MTTIAVIQARMGSTRLPGKVLMDLAGRTVLAWVVRAARQIPGVDRVVVATSVLAQDDQVHEWCEGAGVVCHRGPEADVLARFAMAARAEAADFVLRLTADCPFLDPHVCGQVLALLRHRGADYATNADPRRWPDGLDCEAMTAAALYQADATACSGFEREHVTPYLRNNRRKVEAAFLNCPIDGLATERWTLDTPEDFAFLEQVARYLPDDHPPSYMETLDVLSKNPEMAERQRARAVMAATGALGGGQAAPTGQAPAVSFEQSGEMLRRAKRTIPLGTQTFSKAYTQFPEGGAPLFLSHGRGGRVWDIDGNQYVDLICGLLPVVLGYCDPDVDAAIARQLAEGISFSLASDLEAELAERLVEIIPCAEMVRFGKNGTDATSAAIRLARAFTGRDHVAVCGYHGWQDWYIGSTTRHKGVPSAVRALTHGFPYNDLAALEALLSSRPGEFAAVIMEPVTTVDPGPGYLEQVRDMAHGHGALLVFDEIVTGFRFAMGGAQELFGVTPDLACFGKAMGNGMPISAILGRADVMMEMEEVFFSGTFGGEALSLAASIAVIDKMRREPVLETIWQRGQGLADGVQREIERNDLGDVLSMDGKAPWKLLTIKNHATASAAAIKTMFRRDMLANGVLMGGSHNICYAHNDADMALVIEAYSRTLDAIRRELESGGLEANLACPPIEPVFAVR
jgi:glutamate-1-semialdehyde 2,1-aminomutase